MGTRRSRWLAVVVALAATSAVAGAGSASAARGGPGHAGARQGTHPTVLAAHARGWHDRDASGRVVVEDVTVAVPHQASIPAYVVRPAGHQRAHAAAGVLFLHWLGQVHNDRTEYLAEAATLAQKGVVSVLPQGYFPWVPNPDGTAHDVTLVRNQVAAFEAALDRLAGMRAVDPHRIALVGHDYGAMYGSVLADHDRRVRALVLEAPDALMGNWFAQFWLGLEGADRDAYLALFNGLDPVENTARLGRHVLFQWAGQDFFIGADVRAAFAASSPEAQVKLYDNDDHQLDDVAAADRDAFLAAELHLR
jgi:dienelactone hydrolase